jgi:hypothetical protein
MDDDMTGIYPILKHFSTGHLSAELAVVSLPFGKLAYDMASQSPEGNAETAAGLRLLLQAKDCAVRAALP